MATRQRETGGSTGTTHTIGELLARAARRWPDTPAVHDGGGPITFAQLRSRASALARGLASLGLGHGDHVALWMANGVDWVLADYACVLIGATLVPVNTQFSPDEVHYVLAQSRSVAIVVDAEVGTTDARAVLTQLADRLPHLRHIVVRGTAAPPKAGDIAWTQLAALGRGVDMGPGPGPDDVAYILYTSGTTSFPKGVRLRHRNVLAVASAFGDRFGWIAGDRNLAAPPLFSSYGAITNVLGCLAHGVTLVTLPRFSAARALETMAAQQVTTFIGVDTMLRDMLSLVGRANATAPALRAVLAIPMNLSLAEQVRNVFGAEVHTGYGLTEASACSALTALEPAGANLNVLEPLDGVRFRVVTPDGTADSPPGEVGELWVQAPGVLLDYYDKPEQTARVLVQEGSWLRTGDLASVLVTGRVRFEGRLKDIVKTGGFNVSALEVERVLTDHPAVAEAAYVGVPDERLTEVGVAFVRLAAPDAPPARTTTEILDFCRARLARYKVPRDLLVLDELPLTSTGKVRKGRLREIFQARCPTPAAPVSPPGPTRR